MRQLLLSRKTIHHSVELVTLPSTSPIIGIVLLFVVIVHSALMNCHSGRVATGAPGHGGTYRNVAQGKSSVLLATRFHFNDEKKTEAAQVT